MLNRSRAEKLKRSLPWIYGAGLLLMAATLLWNIYLQHSGTLDLRIYRHGSLTYLQGRDAYLTRYGSPPRFAYTYPPISFYLLGIFDIGSLGLAQILLWSLSLGALALVVTISVSVVAPDMGRSRRVFLVLLISAAALWLEPVRNTLSLGQINLVLLAMVLYDCLAARTRIPRGALTGIATAVKLTPGMFVVYLVLTGRRRAAGNAVISAAALTGAGFVLAPRHSWDYWTRLVFDVRRVGRSTYVANQSLRGVVGRLLSTMEPPAPVLLPPVVAAVVCGLYLARRTFLAGDPLLGAALCGVTGLLVSPISWNHHWVFVVPAIIALCTRLVRQQSWLLLFVLAGWTATFYIGPMWRVEHNSNDLRYSPAGILDVVLADSYAICGVLLIALAGAQILSTRRRLRPGGEVRHRTSSR